MDGPRSGESRFGLCETDVHSEVPEAQVKCRAAGPVNDEREQDDGQDDGHQPEEEHDNAGDGVPGDFPCSSHGSRLPGPARLIPTSPHPPACHLTPPSVQPTPEGRWLGQWKGEAAAYAEARLAVGPVAGPRHPPLMPSPARLMRQLNRYHHDSRGGQPPHMRTHMKNHRRPTASPRNVFAQLLSCMVIPSQRDYQRTWGVLVRVGSTRKSPWKSYLAQ